VPQPFSRLQESSGSDLVDMVKLSVALLASLLVLAGPAAAQDPPGEPDGTEPSGEPDGTEPSGEPDGADPSDGSAPPSEEDPQEAGPEAQQPGGPVRKAARAVECRVAKTTILNPSSSPDTWLVLDPDYCLRQTIHRILGDPTFLLRR